MRVVVCLMPGAAFDRSTVGLLGAARQLGGEITVVAASAGEECLRQLTQHAETVVRVDSPELADYQPEATLTVLHKELASLQPQVVLLGPDAYSQELTPRLAARLGGSSLGDAQQVEASGEHVRVTRSVYGGKATAVIELRRTPAVVWVRARSFEPAASLRAAGTIETRTIELSADERRRAAATQITERHVEAAGEVRLEDAAFIVSGGRGLGGPEPFEQLKELAAMMGAQVAASRAACDAGWAPPHWQIGQTGRKVAPELYLAIAISGASQHLMGIADARVIAAINTDAEAPIFRACQFGLVEDYRRVIGPLRDKLKAHLS